MSPIHQDNWPWLARSCHRSVRPLPKAVGLVALTFLTCGVACKAPLDSIQVLLERHEKAVAMLPEEERARLMPYGEPVVSSKAERLLPTDVLDLESARALAIRANPDIHAAQARLEAARARIAEARARYYPTIVFTQNATRTFHTPASRNRLNTALQPTQPVPTDVDTSSLAVTTIINALRRPLFSFDNPSGNTSSFSEHSTAFTLTWTAFDGFVREANILASKYVYRATTLALVDLERLIIQAVDAAYYQVQLAEEQIRIARADEAFSDEQYEETEKLRAAGRATLADVNNFRVRALAAQAAVTAAVGLRETGRVVLAELLGLEDVTLPESLQLSPLTEETEAELTPPDPQPWIQRAEANRPDLLQLKELLNSEIENVRAANGFFLPTLAISGSWGFDRTSNLRYEKDDQSSAAAVEFRWELFTGGARRARLLQAEAARAEAAARLNRIRLSVQSDVRQAIIALNDAQQQIRLQRENLATAKENRRMVRAGYLAGKETLNRLNEAQRDVIEADADLTQARIQLRQAWSDLHAAAATYRENVGQSENGTALPSDISSDE